MKKIYRILFLIPLCMLTFAACGNDNDIVTGRYYHPSQDEPAQTEHSAEDAAVSGGSEEAVADATEDAGENEPLIGTDLFLITNNDMQAQCLILKQLASGKQYMYNYSLTTRFLDKYGNFATVSSYEPGRVICVGKKDIQGRLLEAQISDRVWEYPDVTRFSVDEERGIFRIADENYSYDENLFLYSDGGMQTLSDLTDMDTLRVNGIGTKILSVSVTTGHGSLRLENTDVFDGSFIQVGKDIFSQITHNMTMELPEGTYVVAVANDGYGGSTEIEVKRGQETALDLDTLKGEGPKYGNILFAVDVEGAVLRIDGEVVDYSQPVELKYGVHALQVTADSYDAYSKKLYVNSEKATIVIGLTGASGSESSGTNADGMNDSAANTGTENGGTTAGTGGGLAGSLAGSYAGGGSAGQTTGGSSGGELSEGNTSGAALDALVDGILDDQDSSSDYLSTIVKALTTLYDKNNN